MSGLPEVYKPQASSGLAKDIESQSLQLLTIKVDGTPVPLPSYAPNISLHDFWWYLSEAEKLKAEGRAYKLVEGFVTGSEKFIQETLAQIADDPKFDDYLEALIRHGPEIGKNVRDGFDEVDFVRCVTLLADRLSPVKGVEIIPPSNSCYREWGHHLKKGLIALRGNAQEVYGMKGGTLFVDGNVVTVDGGEGVVYINGDLEQTRDVESLILIVTGKITEYEIKQGVLLSLKDYSLHPQNTPSPFIFTPDPVPVTQRIIGGSSQTSSFLGRRPQYEEAHSKTHFGNPAYNQRENSVEIHDIKDIYRVPKEKLEGWKPEETRQKAAELLKERTVSALKFLSERVQGAKETKEVMDFLRDISSRLGKAGDQSIPIHFS